MPTSNFTAQTSTISVCATPMPGSPQISPREACGRQLKDLGSGESPSIYGVKSNVQDGSIRWPKAGGEK
jgi:hypothetical protein